MEQATVIKIESLLEKMIQKYKDKNSSVYAECRFAIYKDHYSLIFKMHKYRITTTIKLNLDFTLIGVFVFVEDTSRIVDVQKSKEALRTKFKQYFDVIVQPALKAAGAY